MAQELKTKSTPAIQHNSSNLAHHWRYFESNSRVIRDNSRTIGAISRQSTKNSPLPRTPYQQTSGHKKTGVIINSGFFETASKISK
jgi:hypothetical protein